MNCFYFNVFLVSDYFVALLTEVGARSNPPMSLDFIYSSFNDEFLAAKREQEVLRGSSWTREDVREVLKQRKYHKLFVDFFQAHNLDFFGLYDLKNERNLFSHDIEIRRVIVDRNMDKINADQAENAVKEGEPERICELKKCLDQVMATVRNLITPTSHPLAIKSNN